MPSKNFSPTLHPSFSHIYVEERALQHPRTQKILQKFKRATIIPIPHYKEFFNQKGQDFRFQKQSPKLILAIKEDTFLYEGSQYADGFGFENFFYTPTMLNCMYDCAYCYLQGMYDSANMVYFVNLEDFFDATLAHLDKPTLVCTSYDTDLLSMEALLGENEAWVTFAQQHPNLHLELRSKSANFGAIEHLTPSSQVVLAWTISPQAIIDAYEAKTPSLDKRLRSIQAAIDKGWQVRLCIDPVIYTADFESLYAQLIETLFETVDAKRLFEVTTGTFRMSSDHLKRLKKMGHTALAYDQYTTKDKMVRYTPSVEQQVLHFMRSRLLQHIDETRLRVWE